MSKENLSELMNGFWDSVARFHRLPHKHGNIDGVDWVMGNTGVITVAYIQIPKGHPWYHEDGWRNISDAPILPVNGGCTCWCNADKQPGYFIDGVDEGCWIGWDYGHHWNIDQELTEEEVMEDIKRAIKTLKGANNE